MIVDTGQGFADHERVGGAVGNRSGESNRGAKAVKQTANIGGGEGVSMIRANGIPPAKGIAITELLIGIETARSDGALRPQAADIIAHVCIEVKVIAGAAEIRERRRVGENIPGDADRVGSTVQV